MDGWPAAVMEIVSPSQLIPSEIQRTCTSSTPDATGSVVAMDQPSRRRQRLVDLDALHDELLAREKLDVQAAAARALQWEAVVLGLAAAAPAAAARGYLLDVQP